MKEIALLMAITAFSAFCALVVYNQGNFTPGNIGWIAITGAAAVFFGAMGIKKIVGIRRRWNRQRQSR